MIGNRSPARIQPPKMAHARQAFRRSQILAPTTRTAATIDRMTNLMGGIASAYVPSLSQRQGPPNAPGRNVLPTSPQVRRHTALPEDGTDGCTREVLSDWARITV